MNKKLKEQLQQFYEKRIRGHKDCPVCKGVDTMLADNKRKLWECKECGYSITYDKFYSDYIYWFCDDCEAFLNIQPGFESAKEKWICQCCGYENDITESNIKGQCKDCGMLIDNVDAELCDNCKRIREERKAENLLLAKEVFIQFGKSLLATALSIVQSAAKTAIQTYIASAANGNMLDKETHKMALEEAKNAAIAQMGDEVQGYLISSFGNLGNWVSAECDNAINRLTGGIED